MKIKHILLVIALLSTVAFGVTVKQSVTLTGFNAGELSPLMKSRVDFSKYTTGAQTLENMLVRSQGPVQRRSGTRYIATAKYNTNVRLITFEYSTDDSYIIEIGHEYMRFYRTSSGVSGQIVDVNDDPYEISTPYDGNDVFEIQYDQDAEYMRLVHPDYKPYKLTRTANTSWTCTEVDFESGPFLDENVDTTSTIYADANTGDVNLVATGGIFDDDHVGALWQLSHRVEQDSLRIRASGFPDAVLILDLDNTGAGWISSPNSPAIFVAEERTYDFLSSGNWYGTVTLQRSYDNKVTWEDVTSYTSENTGNIQYTGTEEYDDAYYRIYYDNTSVGGITIFNLNLRSYINNGIVKITAVTDANNATATVDSDHPLVDANTPTYQWSESVWSDYRGWPRTIVHHDQRCVYGGSASYPQAIWASVVASTDTDYDDFDEGEGNDDDAWTYLLTGMNPIQWMISQDYIVIGTTGGIGILGQQDKPISATFPPIFRMHARNGSAYIQAVQAVDAVLFVERGRQKVREISYAYSSDRFIAPDMTILAEHITGDGISSMAFQNRPDPILWCIGDDGTLLSFTYNRKHEVLAWAEQKTGPLGVDDFESVAVMNGEVSEDEIWVAVDREINSTDYIYIEQFAPLDWGTDQNDCYFVDCGGDDVDDISFLEGETVALFADGRPDPNTYTVSSGSITPYESHTYTTVGLPFTSVLETMPLIAFTNYGDSMNKYATVNQVTIDLYETLGIHIGPSSSQYADIQFSDDDFDTTLDLFTGIKTIPILWRQSRNPEIYITESSPVPLTIRNMVVDLDITYE